MPAREQRSEVKGQKSETVREGFMKTERLHAFSATKSIKILLKLVGAGLCARPQGSKFLQFVTAKNRIAVFITDAGNFLSALCSGGRRNPPDSGTLLSAYADISPNRGITRPYGMKHSVFSIDVE